MSSGVRQIAHRSFDAQQLVAEFPPRITNRNKEVVYRIAAPPGCTHSGRVSFSRWIGTGSPAALSAGGTQTAFEAVEGFFRYERPSGDRAAVEWHLNFAHFDLFFAYSGALFAQDEMQVAEHPALGALREALLKLKFKTLTVEDSVPTPVLVRGVERRCEVATDRNAAQGRPQGLYGNAFGRASIETIAKATRAITPPTISNIIAIEAPAGGFGQYSLKQIEYIFRTAYTGFAAATLESSEVDPSAEVVIHTGFWGCGAYGGNRVLMTVLQFLAAQLARIDRLVFHTGDAGGMPAYQQALQCLWDVTGAADASIKVSDILQQLAAKGFEWGVGDGN